MNKLIGFIVVVLFVEAVVLGYQIYQREKPNYLMVIPKTYWTLLEPSDRDSLIQTLMHYVHSTYPNCGNITLAFYEKGNYYHIRLFLKPNSEIKAKGRTCIVLNEPE